MARQKAKKRVLISEISVSMTETSKIVNPKDPKESEF